MGMSITQGGSGYPYFAPSMYKYICGEDVCSIEPEIDEIPDFQLQKTLVEVPVYQNDIVIALVHTITNRLPRLKMI